MTAMTLDLLSGGRFLLGLGTSGPQVVEGWHGAAVRQAARARRASTSRSCARSCGARPLELPRRALRDPVRGPGRDRARQAAQVDRCTRCAPTIPIYLAAIGPKNVRARRRDRRRLAADLLLAERAREALRLEPSRARASRSRRPCTWSLLRRRRDGAATSCADARAVRRRDGRARPNFYNDARATVRLRGRGRARSRISTSAGKKREAIAAVPDALVDEVALWARGSASASASTPGASPE